MYCYKIFVCLSTCYLFVVIIALRRINMETETNLKTRQHIETGFLFFLADRSKKAIVYRSRISRVSRQTLYVPIRVFQRSNLKHVYYLVFFIFISIDSVESTIGRNETEIAYRIRALGRSLRRSELQLN